MRELYQMPLDVLINSELALADEPSKNGEAPQTVDSIHSPPRTWYAQLTITEFPSAYRLLLVLAPIMAKSTGRADHHVHSDFYGQCGKFRYKEAPRAMHAIDTTIAYCQNPIGRGIPFTERGWESSPFQPDGSWEYIAPQHPYDYRTISRRELSKHPNSFPMNEFPLRAVFEGAFGYLYNIGFSDGVPMDLAAPHRLYRTTRRRKT